MMLRVNDEFLDFNDNVEVEKHVKLFERIDETLGDFSYSFSLAKTAKNMRILGNPLPDVKNKIIYRSVQCDILDESGIIVYNGLLRVERINVNIECSFFSGNYNWISLISGNLSDLDLSDLDTELTEANIVASWQNTEGIIYPLIDAGTLNTRGYKSLMIEDFVASVFVKTIFRRIFNSVGIKLLGDLFNDPIFDNLILTSNNYNANDIEGRSSFIQKGSDQDDITPPGDLDALITFTNESIPYFDPGNRFSSSRYTADVKMLVHVEIVYIYTSTTSDPTAAQYWQLYKNGSLHSSLESNTSPTTLTANVLLEVGDYLEAYSRTEGVFVQSIKADSTFRVTPLFIYNSFGSSVVPQWTKAQFVSNILSLFCCICDFDPITKTLTIDFFENVKNKQPIDLSQYLTVYDTDYEDFISSFNQKNLLTYQDSDADTELKKYNISNFVKYGSGEINVENDFIEKTGDIVSSDFTAPVSYVNEAFSCSMERILFLEFDTLQEQDFTSVSDLGGLAQFNVSSDVYTVGELVRISDSTDTNYDGDYLVAATGSGFITLSLIAFSTNASGKITRLRHKSSDDDSVYLFINTKYRTDNVTRYSRETSYLLESTLYTDVAYVFFNLLNTGVPINSDYDQGLSFGEVSSNLFYQRTLIDKYWNSVERVLNDPVKIFCEAYIPKRIFFQITPLRPVIIKTVETSNLYYINRITGYVNSYMPCQVELIKLS